MIASFGQEQGTVDNCFSRCGCCAVSAVGDFYQWLVAVAGQASPPAADESALLRGLCDATLQNVLQVQLWLPLPPQRTAGNGWRRGCGYARVAALLVHARRGAMVRECARKCTKMSFVSE
jgi:hypothetical protein